MNIYARPSGTLRIRGNMDRGHKKSRKGCQQCKSRHVKCDEKKPCSRCKRNDRACSLCDSGEDSAQTSELKHRSIIDARDFELLNHYKTATSETIVTDRSQLYIFQGYLPVLANSFDFLMHGLLALSAYHLAYIHPERQHHHLFEAANHEESAIKLFRDALLNITRENCQALLACSGVLVAGVLAHKAVMPETLTANEIAQLFKLVQGIRQIFLPPTDDGSTCNGLLESLLSHGSPNTAEVSTSLIFGELSRLNELIEASEINCDTQEERRAYSLAIERLQHTCALVRSEGVVQEFMVWMWPSLVPSQFVDLIRESNPLALVVLAYFAVLSSSFNESWFLRGWSKVVLGLITRELDANGGDMRYWIENPKRWLDEGICFL